MPAPLLLAPWASTLRCRLVKPRVNMGGEAEATAAFLSTCLSRVIVATRFDLFYTNARSFNSGSSRFRPFLVSVSVHPEPLPVARVPLIFSLGDCSAEWRFGRKREGGREREYRQKARRGTVIRGGVRKAQMKCKCYLFRTRVSQHSQSSASTSLTESVTILTIKAKSLIAQACHVERWCCLLCSSCCCCARMVYKVMSDERQVPGPCG